MPLSRFPRLVRSPVRALPVLLGISLASTGLAQPAGVAYDLAAALGAVEESNLNALLSRETVQQAIEASKQSRANLLPDVTFNATQRRAQSASFGSNVTVAGITDRFDMNVSARLNLLDPQVLAAYQASKVSVDVAELGAAATLETIRAAVATVYLQHRRNLARLELIDANIARAQALLQLATRQRDAGVATQIDVTRAQAQLAIAQQARLQQQTEVRASELRFQRLLGLSPEQSISLAPFSARLVDPQPFNVSLEETAFAQRPDLQQSTRQLEQNELEVRAAKFNRLPSLALTGQYGRASARAFDGRDAEVWSGALALSMPVFDAQRTASLTRLAMSRRQAQTLRQHDLELAIGAEVRLAVQNTSSRRAQVDVAQTSLSLAEDELRLAQIRFEQGAADNREIIEAQNRLAVASDNLLEATYQYNLSRVELARATGDVRDVLLEQAP